MLYEKSSNSSYFTNFNFEESTTLSTTTSLVNSLSKLFTQYFPEILGMKGVFNFYLINKFE